MTGTRQAGPSTSPEEGLSQERVKALLEQVSQHVPDGVGWELGVHFRGLSEAVKELEVRVGALEEENRHLQERLNRGQREYVQLRESMNELLNLHDLSEAISTSFDTADILDSLMDLSGRFIDYESCGVFALEEEGARLQPMALRGAESSSLQERIREQWDDGIIDWVLREAHPVVIDDMDSLTQDQHASRSFVIIPLMVGGKQVGIFTLYCRRPKDDFTLGEIELLGVLANQTAAAMENSRLYTDLESAHRRLKESQRQLLYSAKQAAVGELAGGVAHEVNNPLQIILSRVQLMISQHGEVPKVVEGLRLIENNVRRISRIIRALLGFASHNTADSEWGLVDLAQAIQQAVALLKHQLDSQLIDVALDVQDDLPALPGDVGELEQIFINLILNAQNAMPDGGRLHISATSDDEGVEIKFTDTGMGIESEHLDRIFEPFFTMRPDEGGTGLGLAVSYRIAEAHNGTLTVDSTPGRGTTFALRLPLSDGDDAAGHEDQNGAMPAT